MTGGRHAHGAVGASHRDRAEPRRILWVLLTCLVLLISLASVFAVRGFHILSLRQQIRASLLARDAALVEREALEHQLSLKDDLSAIEDAAREQLRWILPGEVRVVFVTPSPSTSSEGD
jgi:cell division protein FtsB